MGLSDREFIFTDREFRFLASLASEKTGIVLPDQKKDMVYGRLVRRLRTLKLDSFSEYCDLLRSADGEVEVGNLVNAITTNLTSFFREGHHFESLSDFIVEWKKTTTDRRLRLWSSACSSGMEAYSMAMTLCEALPDHTSYDARILATDIDTTMVNIGLSGRYTARDVENIPQKYKKYVQRAEDGSVKVSDECKRLITFKQLNLLEPWPMKGPFDIIFCRNVVIYFDKPTKETLFDRMASLMKPGGYLYIGHSENLHGVSNRFQLIGRTTYRRVM